MSGEKLLEAASESLNNHIRLRNEYLMAENRNLSHFVWMPPRSNRTHDLVIGLFINRYEFGRLL